MPSTQAVFFDLDGTLLDSLDDLAAAANHALGQLGLPGHTAEQYQWMIGDGAEMLIRRALGSEHESKWPQTLEVFKAYYQHHMLDHSRLFEGVEAMLDQLVEAQCPMAIVSNKPHLATQQVVGQMLGRWPWAEVVGQKEGIPIKPDPAGVKLVAESMQVDPARCLFVGDSANDILAGNGAGMASVGVTWGNRPAEEMIEAGATHMIDHPKMLANLWGPGRVE